MAIPGGVNVVVKIQVVLADNTHLKQEIYSAVVQPPQHHYRNAKTLRVISKALLEIKFITEFEQRIKNDIDLQETIQQKDWFIESVLISTEVIN